MGQENKNIVHFVVQRADLIVARACFPCGSRRPVIYACKWVLILCVLKNCLLAENKTWLPLRLLWSPGSFTDSAACLLVLPLHTITISFPWLITSNLSSKRFSFFHNHTEMFIFPPLSYIQPFPLFLSILTEWPGWNSVSRPYWLFCF